MPQETLSALDFGEPKLVDRSLSDNVRGLTGSEILRIAADVRELMEAGRPLCNLTVGDFNPEHFPVPHVLLQNLQRALQRGETNYPPSNGLKSLREAVIEFTARCWGARYPLESVLIGSGARPILYGAYRTVLNPGDQVVYPVPSWNNNHYTWISGAQAVPLPTRAEDGFMPTLDQLAPHLSTARMICLNSPLNPTGTMISEPQLRAIVEAVVEENHKRTAQKRRHLFLLHDQVYSLLVFGSTPHVMPVSLVPESAPWVISLDGISKGFAATGLRVGWLLAAPDLAERMKNLLGHVGAWAPRAEQVAVAEFLRDTAAVDAFQRGMNKRVQERLDALYHGFTEMRERGYPVECIRPQGAIYLSLRLDLIGRSIGGLKLDSNEVIRKVMLDRAGMAMVPFQAFGLDVDSGWFRLSIGAVSRADIDEALPRLRRVLDELD